MRRLLMDLVSSFFVCEWNKNKFDINKVQQDDGKYFWSYNEVICTARAYLFS